MKRDVRLDVIRTVAIFMIFTFHFCSAIGNTGIFYGYANGGWGSVGTTIFFLLSGFLLGKRYREKISLKKFYWKRWLSIFPLFYLTFAAAFIVNGITAGNWRYGGSLWRLIFTILGCDNYLGFYGISSYAIVGEWFTAVIVIVYIVYPFLHYLSEKSRLWGSVLVYGLYFLNLGVDWFQVVDDANPITGIAMFWTGMLFAEYAEKISYKWLALPKLAVAALILFVKLPGNPLLWKNMLGFMIFGILYVCAGCFEKAPLAAKGFSYVSMYSYAAYLCHHYIIFQMLPVAGRVYTGRLQTLVWYMLCFVVTALVSFVLYQVMEFLKRGISMHIRNRAA